LQEFPDSPPPGLVTVPTVEGQPQDYYAMIGYRSAGSRAIRIDMLERLADMLRVEDSRGGFEAKADMLSITGMTLEQFSDLMEGLGYKAEKGERAKVKATPAPAEAVAEGDAQTSEPAEDPAKDDAVAETPVEDTAAEAVAPEVSEPEVEVFYTFTWGRKPQRQGGGGKPQGQRPQGNKPRGKGKPRRDGGGNPKAKQFQARPPKKEKAIDPDNPFAAALMGFKKD